MSLVIAVIVCTVLGGVLGYLARRDRPSESLPGPRTDLEKRVSDLEADFIAWEARASKLTREMSRHLKAIAEVERREQLRAAEKSIDFSELEQVDDDDLDRLLRDIKSRGPLNGS